MHIIFDLDNTISDASDREHLADEKNWDAFNAASVNDPVIEPVRLLIQSLYLARHNIHIWTSRDGKYFEETIDWLLSKHIYHHTLRMRDTENYTPSHELKSRWLDESSFTPDLVFEDSAKLVQMYRARGILCFDLANNPF